MATDFSVDGLFGAQGSSVARLQAYLRSLLDHSERLGRQPVLKFCRSLGRIAWMRQCFPQAAHIVLARNPVSQFVSARRQLLDHANPYFLAATLQIPARHADTKLVAAALEALDVRLPEDAAVAERAGAYVAAAPAAACYRLYLAFWLACAAAVPVEGVLFLDSDLLVISPAYRRDAQARLRGLGALRVDLGDAKGSVTTRARRSWLGLTELEIAFCHQAALDFLSRHAAPAHMLRAVRLLSRATMVAVGAEEVGAALAPPLTDPFAESAALRSQLGEERRQRAAAQAALAAIQASTCWRMTAPVRAVLGALTGPPNACLTHDAADRETVY